LREEVSEPNTIFMALTYPSWSYG